MKTRAFGSILLACLLWPMMLSGQVSFDRILNAQQEPQNWLTYSGTTFSHRHSLLTQIAPANVKNLELQWIYQAQSLEKFEATALVVDGVMYTVQAPNDVVALDAATGRVFWVFPHVPVPWAKPCCGFVNRGLAMLGDTLFLATIDAHLIAIDAKGGHPVWDTTVADAKSGYVLTLAPLVVKDKVIVGTAGGDYGVRGFIAAYDVKTGRECWRFYTIPGPGDPGGSTWAGDSWQTGGGSVWITGSYDAALNLTYWGTGNPSPDYNGDPRLGDNLYTDSVVALDPDTGRLQWHYQFTPHEEFDWDSAQVPVLVDLEQQEKDGHKRLRKVMMWANRNGLFYVLDRQTGEFLLGKPFVEVNWMKGFDEKGRPMIVPGKAPSSEGTVIYPGNRGGTSWYSPSYSPRTGLFYVSTWQSYSSVFFKFPPKSGEELGGGFRSVIPDDRVLPQLFRKDEEGHGAVIAIDPKTGEKKWEFKMADVTDAGILTTASDLLFSGGRDGYFFALNARDGALLWKVAVGGVVASGPMTYSVRGRQYVAVAAGNSLFVFALRE